MKNLLFCILALSLFGCKKESGELQFKQKVIVTYGEKDESLPGWIGEAGVIAVNSNLDVYIVDLAAKKIKRYNKDGKFLRDYGGGKGRGPGEFLDPFAIDVDELNNIYIADLAKREITIIDSNNNVKRILKTKFGPSAIAVISPGVFCVAGASMTYSGDLIYKYDINKKEEWDAPVKVFCERIEIKDNQAYKVGIGRNCLKNDGAGNIYFSFSYPYEIREFSRDGIMTNKITRDVYKFTPPYFTEKEGRKITVWDNAISDPMLLTEDILCVQVFQFELGKEYIDFFDLKTSSYIGHINTKSLGFEQTMGIAADNRGNLYYSESEPYPHIVKFSLGLMKQ